MKSVVAPRAISHDDTSPESSTATDPLCECGKPALVRMDWRFGSQAWCARCGVDVFPFVAQWTGRHAREEGFGAA